jgi:hypothetical protein
VIVSSSQADYPSVARAQRLSELLRTAALSTGDAARELEIDESTVRGYCAGQPAPRHVTLAIERLVHLRSIKVYHIARAGDAVDILDNGFRDGMDSGVRVSNRLLVHLSPIDPNDMACFQMKVSREWLLRHECGDKGHGYREFLVPAVELNDFPRRRLPDKDWLSMPWGR